MRLHISRNGNTVAPSALDATPEAGTTPFHGLLSRSIQLDALGYLLIAALLILVAVLGFMLFNSVRPPADWLFGRESVQLLALALIGALVLYLLDQHSRLRSQLKASLSAVDLARASAVRSAASLTSAHHAAEIMVSIAEEGALDCVVETILKDFEVGAVAIMGDDAIARFADDTPADEVLEVFSELAVEVVRVGAPIGSYRGAGGAALAVPLRVFERLRGVMCLWQSDPARLPEVEGVELLGRVVELGWESRLLYEGTNSNAKGLSELLVRLIDERVPGYSSTTEHLIDMLERLSGAGAFGAECLAEVRLAATLRDIGILRNGSAAVDHPSAGAQLVHAVGLPYGVEEAVRLHHGTPDISRPSAIGAAARALSVCVARTESSGPTPVIDPPTVDHRIRLGRSPEHTPTDPTAPGVLFPQEGLA